MRYGLESTLPLNAFSPRARGPFAHGMTLEGGSSWTDPIDWRPVGKALASVDPGPAIGGALAKIDPGPAIGKAFADLDKSVGKSIPGGWKSVGSVAAMVAAPYASAYLAAATGMSGTAAAATYGAAIGGAKAAASKGNINQILTSAALGGLLAGGAKLAAGALSSTPPSYAASDFIAEDAAGMAKQGLSQAQIADTLKASGVDSVVAGRAAERAFSGLDSADISKDLASAFAKTPMFTSEAVKSAATTIANGTYNTPTLESLPNTQAGAQTQMLTERGFNAKQMLDQYTPEQTDAILNSGLTKRGYDVVSGSGYSPEEITTVIDNGGVDAINNAQWGQVDKVFAEYAPPVEQMGPTYGELGYTPPVGPTYGELGYTPPDLGAIDPGETLQPGPVEAPTSSSNFGLSAKPLPGLKWDSPITPPAPESYEFGLNPELREGTVLGNGLNGGEIGKVYMEGAGGKVATDWLGNPIDATSLGFNAGSGGGVNAWFDQMGIQPQSGGALGNPLSDAYLDGSGGGISAAQEAANKKAALEAAKIAVKGALAPTGTATAVSKVPKVIKPGVGTTGTTGTGSGLGTALGTGAVLGGAALGAGALLNSGNDANGSGQAALNWSPVASNVPQLNTGGLNPGYMLGAVQPYQGQQYDWSPKPYMPDMTALQNYTQAMPEPQMAAMPLAPAAPVSPEGLQTAMSINPDDIMKQLQDLQLQVQ